MRVGIIHARKIATILSMLLGLMVVLASTSSTPTVKLTDISSLDDGQEVYTSGIVADISVFDSGSEALLLTEEAGGAVLKVICSPGVRQSPSGYIDVGDEVRVLGEVSNSRATSVLFSDSDHIDLRRTSEYVLTVETLSKNWLLFEGDEIRITGILMGGAYGKPPRLFDPDMDHGISLRVDMQNISRFESTKVLVDGILRLDPNSMAFYIDSLLISEAHGNPFLEVQRWALSWRPHYSPSMIRILLTGCAPPTWPPF